jgi:hypothetical protein
MLLQRKLINDGLVPLTPKLIERYNECLIRSGLAPTKSATVWVDGVGWSPQVAREQENRFYLCNGLINPLSIIVSPEQYKKPVYFPIFSWQRPLMRLFFDKYHREIIDITTTHSITLDLEDGISALENPLELLLLSEITAVPDTQGLVEAGVAQSALVTHFHEGLNCLENEVRENILNSRRQFGDLRRRQISVASVTFNMFQDFHTVAYDGVFVFRNVSGEDMLIFEDEAQYTLVGGNTASSKVYWIGAEDPSPYNALMRAGWIEVPLEDYQKHPTLLEEKRELLLGWSLCDCESRLSWDTLSPSKRKNIVNSSAHRTKVPEIYFELERFAAALKSGSVPTELSRELWFFLAVPSSRVPPVTREILWTLLTRRDPRNILECYTHDKNYFLTVFDGLGKQKQEWVANYIAARYQPRMSQP